MTILDAANENYFFLKIKTSLFQLINHTWPRRFAHLCNLFDEVLYKTVPRHWLLDVPYSLCIIS